MLCSNKGKDKMSTSGSTTYKVVEPKRSLWTKLFMAMINKEKISLKVSAVSVLAPNSTSKEDRKLHYYESDKFDDEDKLNILVEVCGISLRDEAKKGSGIVFHCIANDEKIIVIDTHKDGDVTFTIF